MMAATSGVRLLDVSTPTQIVEVDRIADSDGAFRIAFDPTTSRFAYVKNGGAGSVVLGHIR